VRLVCCHPAGAGAACFASWRRRLPADVQPVPYELPGRGRRAGRPPLHEPAAVLADMTHTLREVLDDEAVPWAVYGHSLGALLGYALALSRQAAGAPPPVRVVVAAAAPPHLPSLLADGPPPSDRELLARLVALGGLPAGTVDPGCRTARHVLPVIREDLRLARALRTETVAVGAALRAPLLVVAGRDDVLAPPGAARRWDRYAAGPFALRTVPGGHFFLREPPVTAVLAQELAGVQPAGGFRPESSAV
jgi:surfactin synthase thioesterase subunit